MQEICQPLLSDSNEEKRAMKSNDTTADDKFWTELSRAGEVGDGKRFNELLDSVGKVQISMVNEYDDDFWTPLMHAVEDGDMKRFEELIADGADVNIGNLETETYPITLAAEYGRDEIFFRLIELGASMDVDQYCCPCCDMWYGFNPADLFVLAMEAGSVKIARYLHFMGVRPWSKMRSLGSCGRTVMEVAAASGKMGFIKAIFTERELAQKGKREVNVYEWLGWERIRICQEVHYTHDSGFWPVAVKLPRQCELHNMTAEGGSYIGRLVRICTAKCYYAIRLWEEACKACVANGLDANTKTEWYNFSPGRFTIRYKGRSDGCGDCWDVYVSAMYDEMKRIADSRLLKIRTGRNAPAPSANSSTAGFADYVIPDCSATSAQGWTEDFFKEHPSCGDEISYDWSEICDAFVSLTGAQVAFLNSEKLPKLEGANAAFMKACEGLDVKGMEAALAAGADVFAIGNGESAAEMIADAVWFSKMGNSSIPAEKCLELGRRAFECLLAHGGDLDFAGYGSCTALYEAGHGFPELMKMLLDMGADPNAASFFWIGGHAAPPLDHVIADSFVLGDVNGVYAEMEDMLCKAGGICDCIPSLDSRQDLNEIDSDDLVGGEVEVFPDDMPQRDRCLIQAVRRGYGYCMALAVRWGADTALRDEQGRSLVRIFLEDYECYLTRHHTRPDEERTRFMAGFMRMLLHGFRVPLDCAERTAVEVVCRRRGYDECLKVLAEIGLQA